MMKFWDAYQGEIVIIIIFLIERFFWLDWPTGWP
jgi:hypothetical protein